jgi:hypothetical protein
MNKSIVLVCIAVIALGVTAVGSTSCVQTFTIYGKTAGEHGVLMWDVSVDGECEFTTSYCLFLGNDRPYLLTTASSAKDVFPQFLSEHRPEKSVMLRSSEGKHFISKSIYVTPPPSDSTFQRKFNKVINDGGRDASDWYKACPVHCSDYPIFFGTDAKLVYEYRDGLYKNYAFSQVIFFPKSKYLVLVTDQPTRAVGLDTMHGLLVYKLTAKEVSK